LVPPAREASGQLSRQSPAEPAIVATDAFRETMKVESLLQICEGLLQRRTQLLRAAGKALLQRRVTQSPDDELLPPGMGATASNDFCSAILIRRPLLAVL
jgi:hypothetical protein